MWWGGVGWRGGAEWGWRGRRHSSQRVLGLGVVGVGKERGVLPKPLHRVQGCRAGSSVAMGAGGVGGEQI